MRSPSRRRGPRASGRAAKRARKGAWSSPRALRHAGRCRSIRSSRAGEAERCMGRGDDDAAGRDGAAISPTEGLLGGRSSARSARRGARGAERHEQPRERDPPALAGRQIGDRQVRPRAASPTAVEGLARATSAASPRRSLREGEVLRRRQRRSSGRRDGRPRWSALRERPLADALRPDRARVRRQAAGEDVRAGEDFPAPLRPVTDSASPA